MKLSTLIVTLTVGLALLLLTWLLPLFIHGVDKWLGFWVQIILTSLIAVACTGVAGWYFYQRRKKKQLVNTAEIIDQQKKKQLLTDDWQCLWQTIAKRKMSGIYGLPWLMVLGSDGEEKTDWLVNAGYEKSSRHDVLGITFWLSENAVVIELLSDYCIPEKDTILEILWFHLLQLLTKKRPRQPLTGIVMSISVSELIQNGPSGLLQQAYIRRSCLIDLNRHTDLQLPVWVLVTQLDRLNGFVELFRRQSSQRQVEPWGIFLKEGYNTKDFKHTFEQCHRELVASLLDCIHHEKEVNARQAQVRFILQFSLLGERLLFFCEECFKPLNDIQLQGLKGVWFSANGQSSSSINFLAVELAKQHDLSVLLEQPQIPDNQSYFNQQFSQHVLLNDIGNTGESPKYRRIVLFKKIAVRMSTALLLFSGLYFLWDQDQQNAVLLKLQRKIVSEYNWSLHSLGPAPSFSEVVPLLNSLQQLNNAYQNSKDYYYYAGVRDAQVVGNVHKAYCSQLKDLLIQPVARILRDNLKKAIKEHGDQRVFDELQIYLTFIGEYQKNNTLLTAQIYQMIIEHERSLPEEKRLILFSLLSDAVALDSSELEDKSLVAEARQLLNNSSDEQLLYSYIKTLPENTGYLSITDVFGNNSAQLISDKTEEGNAILIPRFYTKSAYQSLDFSNTSSMLRAGLNEIYRIKNKKMTISTIQLADISAKIRTFYFQDYIQAWNSFINQLSLQKASSYKVQLRQIKTINNNDSGILTTIYNTIASETALAQALKQNAEELAGKAVKEGLEKKSTEGAKHICNYEHFLNKAITSSDNPIVVNNAFKSYQNYSAAFVKNLSPLLHNLEDGLEEIINSHDPNAGSYNLALQVFTDKKNILSPLWQQETNEKTVMKQWLNELMSELWSTVIAKAASHVQSVWSNTVYPLWVQNLNGYFPLSILSMQDAQLSAFTEFFKPAGTFETFYQSTLKPFMLESPEGVPSTLNSVEGVQLPLKEALQQQIILAHKLRELLFTADGTLIVHYRMRALELSPDVTGLSLRDSNGRFVYSHGPQLWQDRQWPKQPSEQVVLSLTNNTTQIDQQVYKGEWAWLHFTFSCIQWERKGHIELQYNSKGYQASFDIMPSKRGNPFSPDLYSHIRLPSQIIQ